MTVRTTDTEFLREPVRAILRQASEVAVLPRFRQLRDHEIIEKLNRLIEAGPFEVHIARTFSLEQAADAHRALDAHYLGKLALRPR